MKFMIVLLLAACAGPHQFSRRASFDIQCNEESISFVELSRNVYGATGCGRQATYRRICSTRGVISNGFGGFNAVNHCEWVRN